MKASELISALEKRISEHGDLDVWFFGRDEPSPVEKVLIDDEDSMPKKVHILLE